MLQRSLFDAKARANADQRFTKFHEDNPGVYQEMVRLARQLKAKGHTHYSCDSLAHVIRFHRKLVDKPDSSGFEINNDYIAIYSRLIMDREEDLKGFFETRKRKSEACKEEAA